MINNFILSIKSVILVLLPVFILGMLVLGIMACLFIYMPYPLLWVIAGIILFLMLVAGAMTWIGWLIDRDIL